MSVFDVVLIGLLGALLGIVAGRLQRKGEKSRLFTLAESLDEILDRLKIENPHRIQLSAECVGFLRADKSIDAIRTYRDQNHTQLHEATLAIRRATGPDLDAKIELLVGASSQSVPDSSDVPA